MQSKATYTTKSNPSNSQAKIKVKEVTIGIKFGDLFLHNWQILPITSWLRWSVSHHISYRCELIIWMLSVLSERYAMAKIVKRYYKIVSDFHCNLHVFTCEPCAFSVESCTVSFMFGIINWLCIINQRRIEICVHIKLTIYLPCNRNILQQPYRAAEDGKHIIPIIPEKY